LPDKVFELEAESTIYSLNHRQAHKKWIELLDVLRQWIEEEAFERASNPKTNNH
jgi:hypothetical protein